LSLVAGLLHETIDIYSTVLNKNSDRTRTILYSNVECRWEENVSVVVGKDVKEKRARVNVWILPTYTILEDYEIIKDDEVYKIVAVSKRKDINGNTDHIRLWLA